jgi:hypothetical protein
LWGPVMSHEAPAVEFVWAKHIHVR